MSNTVRNSGIASTLTKNVCASSMLTVMAREGKTDGVGYLVDFVQPGRGFSSTEYALKTLPNGCIVVRRTFFPGPLDGLAGLPTDVVEEFTVWVGWEHYNLEYEALYDAPPGLNLPEGAKGWTSTAFDGPRNWYAVFNDAETAERFAVAMPSTDDSAAVPALVR